MLIAVITACLAIVVSLTLLRRSVSLGLLVGELNEDNYQRQIEKRIFELIKFKLASVSWQHPKLNLTRRGRFVARVIKLLDGLAGDSRTQSLIPFYVTWIILFTSLTFALFDILTAALMSIATISCIVIWIGFMIHVESSILLKLTHILLDGQLGFVDLVAKYNATYGMNDRWLGLVRDRYVAEGGQLTKKGKALASFVKIFRK